MIIKELFGFSDCGLVRKTLVFVGSNINNTNDQPEELRVANPRLSISRKLRVRNRSILKLMRPHQYIKNFFIFLPLFFASRITDTTLLLNASIAFVAFSLSASSIYTLNDYHDIEEYRQHPKKKGRPLASGAISKSQAIFIMASVVIVAFTIYTTSAEVVDRVHSEYLYLTAIFVILGIMRYLQIAFVLKESGFPTRIVLQDHFMQLTLLGWIITFAWILY